MDFVRTYDIPEGDVVNAETVRQFIAKTWEEALGNDVIWEDSDSELLLIEDDGTWCLPGTFGTDYGKWAVADGKVTIIIEGDDGPPCPTCEFARTCDACKAEDAYYAYMAERVERLGEELAMLPDFMECYECARNPLMLLTPRRIVRGEFGIKCVMRRPVGLGPIADERRDPTQTYRVECGHVVM